MADRRIGNQRRIRVAAVLAAGAVTVAVMQAQSAAADPDHSDTGRPPAGKHVLLVSIDGLHASDLAWYVAHHPGSALAKLAADGTTYTHASTTFPSDSFPGMVAQLTGGGPGTTGVYYDDTYNRSLLPAGTTNCAGAAAGSEVAWTEAADRSQNPITLDAGQGLSDPALTALPTNPLAQTLASAPAIDAAILKMTPAPQTLLNPAALPVDPTTCKPVYPHTYLRTNTVFEVARAAGLRTAWSDKHPAYEILNGPSGTGVQDLFTPEINSVADAAGDDWTKGNLLTQEYDSTKVAAVLNEIDGYDHSRSHKVGTPAVFGMNFQAVSTAQKLPKSDGLAGGYLPDGTPGPLLSKALDYVDTQIGAFASALHRDHLQESTTMIVSAKHGQSPIDLSALRRVDDGAIIDGLNAAWITAHPQAAKLVTFSTDDDVMLLWLSDRSKTAEQFAKAYLLAHTAPANLAGDPKGVHSATVTASGLAKVAVGEAADDLLGAPDGDTHAPDLVGITQHGVVYTGGVAKIAEHGGDSADDRNVALIVSEPGTAHHQLSNAPVSTTQIAPTILKALGLNPKELTAVRAGRTRPLN